MVSSRHNPSLGIDRTGGVLVVDDDPEALEIIALQLVPLSVVVHTASSAEAALAILKSNNRPEVVITDYSMPGMKGAELCQRIRADASLATIYVLMLTGYDSADGQQKIGRGADEYLSKPYTATLLRSIVRSGLRAQAHGRVMARRERRRAIEWLTNVVAHELNSPLTVARSALECAMQIVSENAAGKEAGESDELDEMLREVETQLARLQAAARRLCDNGQSLSVGAATTISTAELLGRLEAHLTETIVQRLSVLVEDNSAVRAYFDETLLISAVVPLLAAAAGRCDGHITISVHFDNSRVAVLLELEGAPEQSPESILEPRLAATGNAPATFTPGLSALETGFARFGGQIFARPIHGRWRFGLTLPVADEQRLAS